MLYKLKENVLGLLEQGKSNPRNLAVIFLNKGDLFFVLEHEHGYGFIKILTMDGKIGFRDDMDMKWIEEVV